MGAAAGIVNRHAGHQALIGIGTDFFCFFEADGFERVFDAVRFDLRVWKTAS